MDRKLMGNTKYALQVFDTEFAKMLIERWEAAYSRDGLKHRGLIDLGDGKHIDYFDAVFVADLMRKIKHYHDESRKTGDRLCKLKQLLSKHKT